MFAIIIVRMCASFLSSIGLSECFTCVSAFLIIALI